jgi:hypothetical protein
MNKQFLLETLKDTVDLFSFLIKISLFLLPGLISFLLFLWGIGNLLANPILAIVSLIFAPIMMFISMFFGKLFFEFR